MKSYNLLYYFIIICLLHTACHREISQEKTQKIVFHCDSAHYTNFRKDKLDFCYTVKKKMVDGQEYSLINMGISVCDSIGYFRKYDNKIYYLPPNSTEKNKLGYKSHENILIDANLKVGDTVNLFSPFVVSKALTHLNEEHIYELKRIKFARYVDEGCTMSGLVIGDVTGFSAVEYTCYPSGVLRFYADSIALDSIKLFL